MQFQVLHYNLDLLEVAFEKLNKKCEKYGCSPLSFVVLDTFEENKRLYANIEVNGCVPRVENCELVGVISKLDDGSNIVMAVPNEEVPEQFRSNEFFCDHCGINRYRKEVVIVKNDQGEYKQLGKSCLKDYLGINLEQLVNKFSWVYELCTNAGDENYEFGPRTEYTVDPQKYLECVSVCCRKLSYVSTKRAYEENLQSTKAIAFELMFPTMSTHRFIKEYDLYVEDEDKDIAVKALEWAKSLDGKNDFEINVRAVASQERVRFKFCGFLAAIIPCYRRHIEGELKKQQRSKNPSEWIGEPKKRMEDTAVCVFMKEFDTQYGTSCLVKFVTVDGNMLTWFASNYPDFKQGQEYNIKFTVKEHSEYNGEKQTLINRVKEVILKEPVG